MDETDVQILCDMAFREGSYNVLSDRHPSYAGTARRLGLDEKTIRTRVGRMEKDGFIKYYQAVPSLALFGLGTEALYRFEALNLATKHAALGAVLGLSHVLDAFDFLGATVVVNFVGESLDATQRAADGLASQFEMSSQFLGATPLDPPPMTPDRLDWKIIKTLRYDARRTTRDLARVLSITPRMVEYRLARLLNSRALRIRAILDSQRQHGLVFYELEISVEPARAGEIVQELRRRYGAKFWSVHRPSDETFIFNLFGFTLAEPEANALEALDVKGVRRSAVFVQKEALEPRRPNWIDQRVEGEVLRLDPSTTTASATASPVKRS